MSHPLLRPKWLVRHLLVLVLVLVMPLLGVWQLRRLHDRRAFNHTIESRADEPVVPFDVLVPAGASIDAGGVEWRRVSLTATYRPGSEVTVANRTYQGQPGSWLVSLADLPDGRTVAVVRGFVSRAALEGPALEPSLAPPAGAVQIEGLLQKSRGGGVFATDRVAGRPEMSRLDLGKLGAREKVDLGALFVQVETQDPPLVAPTSAAPGLVAVPRPDLSDGPHLSYAVQWFLFTLVALVGYPLILRKAAAGPGDDPAAPGVGPEGADRAAASVDGP